MFWQLGTNPANIVKFLVVKPIYISLYVNMLLETVVIFVYCGVGISRYQSNMESNMRNYKTQSEYNLHSSGLRVLRNRAGVLFSTLPKGHAIVSDVNGGEFYGIESGKYYPTKLLLRLNRLIQTEGKYDWIQWHSTYDGLSYHVGHVCSNDYRFIHDISSLPENATVTLDPVIIEDPEITGELPPLSDAVQELIDGCIAEDEKFIEGIE